MTMNRIRHDSGRHRWSSHGSGAFKRSSFAMIGRNVVFEKGVLVFHPENIEIGDNVYIGHYTILHGYHKNKMRIADEVWIGQLSFLHSAGGLTIGSHVGIGPGVKILTSAHEIDDKARPILDGPIRFAPVRIGDGCDIGAAAVILPGVGIGPFSQIGAGSVVVSSIKRRAVAAGVPAKIIRMRR